MHDAASVGALDLYHDHVQHFARAFGAELWMLLSQADRRMRGEHWERVRRRGEAEHRAAVDAGRAHGFRAAQPWDWVLRASIADFTFWYREFESPAVLVKAKAASVGQHLGIDSEGAAAGSRQPPTRRPTAPPPADRGAKRPPTGSGTHSKNRKGTWLCQDFQRGACHSTKISHGSDRCAKDGISAHQCNLCLGQHVPGAADCRGDLPGPWKGDPQDFKRGRRAGRSNNRR